MKAYRKELVIYDENRRDVYDNRKKVAYAVFSYFTDNGIEYRKKFQLPTFTPEIEFWNIAPKEINVN